MKNDLIDSISLMIPMGNRLQLPTDRVFSNYAAVKKALLTAGGVYKRSGFEFKEDAATIQSRLCGGEVINDVKKFQYYPTPKELAMRMVQQAGIESHHRVLEPQAGQGHIVDCLPEIRDLVLVELMPENYQVLTRKYMSGDYTTNTISIINEDFLKYNPDEGFDRIIANPPFTKNQDIDHVLHMYDLLNPDGRIVSLMSPSWIHGSQKKQVAFREWFDEVNGRMEEIPEGTFKQSGTNVRTILIDIYKPMPF